MFEKLDEIQAAVEVVYGMLSRLRRGQTLRHEEIRDSIGYEPHEGRWDHILKSARARLQNEDGIGTFGEWSVGYRLMTVAEQVEEPSRRKRRMVRQSIRGEKCAMSIPVGSMTFHQRLWRDAEVERLKNHRKSLQRELREESAARRPAPTMPQLRPQAVARQEPAPC